MDSETTSTYDIRAQILDIVVFALLVTFCILILFFVIRLCFKFTRRFPHRRGQEREEEEEKRGGGVGEEEKMLSDVINRCGVGLSGAGGAQRFSVA